MRINLFTQKKKIDINLEENRERWLTEETSVKKKHRRYQMMEHKPIDFHVFLFIYSTKQNNFQAPKYRLMFIFDTSLKRTTIR